MSSAHRVIQDLFELQKYAIKLGLDNIRFMCDELGNPQKSYPIIHVAGTNGKGSTSFFIAAFLQQAGLTVGLFTSPHLVDFRERIQVNEEKIKLAFIEDFWKAHKQKIHSRQATFFDTSAALAFAYFREMQVDVVVLETGLGGRLDSTNIAPSEIVVITPIQLDHEKQLGDTLKQIAAEKAGIFKPGAAVFSALQQGPVLAELKRHLSFDNAFFYAPDYLKISNITESLTATRFDLENELSGSLIKNLISTQLTAFQAHNQALAFSVSEYFLDRRGKTLTEQNIRRVLEMKIWPGRLQRISADPSIFFDVSHNPAGMEITLNFLQNHIKKEDLFVLVGLVDDKDYKQISRLISNAASKIVVCEPDTHRKLGADKLALAFAEKGQNVKIIKDPQNAYEFCKKERSSTQTLVVIGSHYLIGRLMRNRN